MPTARRSTSRVPRIAPIGPSPRALPRARPPFAFDVVDLTPARARVRRAFGPVDERGAGATLGRGTGALTPLRLDRGPRPLRRHPRYLTARCRDRPRGRSPALAAG